VEHSSELSFITEPSSVEDASDPDSDGPPGVFLLGSPDGEKAFAAFRAHLAETLGEEAAKRRFRVEDAPLGITAFGEDPDPLHLAARKPFVAVAVSGRKPALEILRACLATEGRIDGGWRDEPATVHGVSALLSDLAGRVWLKSATGRPVWNAEVIARVAAAGFGGANGRSVTRIVVDRKGARIQRRM
jgi:hypothetical protein